MLVAYGERWSRMAVSLPTLLQCRELGKKPLTLLKVNECSECGAYLYKWTVGGP